MKVIVFYRHLRSELEQTVIACLAGRNAQEVSYSRFVQTPSGESRRFLSDICNADPQEHRLQYLRSCTRACSTKSYTALNELLNGCKERAEVLVGYSRIKLATVFFGGDHCILWGMTKGFVYSHETTWSLFVVFAEGARTVKMNPVYGLALHEVSVAQVIRASAGCLGGHRFESCRGLRFFLLPTIVTCWIFHFSHLFHELKNLLSFTLSSKMFCSFR